MSGLLLLGRHGQTGLNAEQRVAGRLDVPLTEVGERQAALMAATILGRVEPVRVISSPLLRARQTAAALGRPVEVDERWVELDYGEYDGRRLDEVPGAVWEAWRSDPGFAPPGGESLAAVGQRVRAACEELAAGGETVVVISHVSPIKAAVAWALDVGDEAAWRMYLAPGSLTAISLGARTPSLHAFNETVHLS